MADFPVATFLPETIGIASPECPLTPSLSGVTPGSSSLTQNRAYYVPIVLERPVLVRQLAVINGATINGNLDLGIYDYAGIRLVSSGSTAQSGANAVQLFDITDTPLSPGLYYLALASNSATATVYRWAGPTHTVARALGYLIQDTAFALPATATFAAMTSGTPAVPNMFMVLGRAL